jgi:hypothetical protein
MGHLYTSELWRLHSSEVERLPSSANKFPPSLFSAIFMFIILNIRMNVSQIMGLDVYWLHTEFHIQNGRDFLARNIADNGLNML